VERRQLARAGVAEAVEHVRVLDAPPLDATGRVARARLRELF
jgi:hypothetical protein